jgi:hypothetical protein
LAIRARLCFVCGVGEEMKILQVDEDGGVLRAVSRMVIIAIPLVLIMGWPRLIVVLPGLILFHGMGRIGRLGDVADKPFSFCLPGFRESLRKRYFLAATIMGLALSTYPLVPIVFRRSRHPSVDVDLVKTGLGMVAGFLTGVVLALVMGTLRFVFSPLVYNTIMLLSIPLFLLAVVVCPAFMEYPLIGIPLCAAACVFFWSRLHDMRRVHCAHRTMVQEVLHPDVETPRRRQAMEYRVDALFRRRMERHAYLSAGRYCWDELYRLLGPLLCRWRTVLFWLAVAAVVLSLLGEAIAGLAFILFALVVLTMHLPLVPDHVLLLPVGRRERSAATVLVAAGISAMHTAFGAVVIVLSWLIGLVAGILPLERLGSASFLKIDPAFFYWPCLLVPWMVASRLLRGRAAQVVQVAIVLVIVLLWAEVYLCDMVLPWGLHALYACVLICGWSFFLVVARARRRVGDLI